jgi:hypothetical protein
MEKKFTRNYILSCLQEAIEFLDEFLIKSSKKIKITEVLLILI